jgi:hypothetical protein
LLAQRPDIQDRAAKAIQEMYGEDDPMCSPDDDQLHATKVVTVSRPPESMVKLIDVNSSLFSLASLSMKKAAEMRRRRDKYLGALNSDLDDRMAKGTHKPCIHRRRGI